MPKAPLNRPARPPAASVVVVARRPVEREAGKQQCDGRQHEHRERKLHRRFVNRRQRIDTDRRRDNGARNQQADRPPVDLSPDAGKQVQARRQFHQEDGADHLDRAEHEGERGDGDQRKAETGEAADDRRNEDDADGEGERPRIGKGHGEACGRECDGQVKTRVWGQQCQEPSRMRAAALRPAIRHWRSSSGRASFEAVGERFIPSPSGERVAVGRVRGTPWRWHGETADCPTFRQPTHPPPGTFSPTGKRK